MYIAEPVSPPEQLATAPNHLTPSDSVALPKNKGRGRGPILPQGDSEIKGRKQKQQVSEMGLLQP